VFFKLCFKNVKETHDGSSGRNYFLMAVPNTIQPFFPTHPLSSEKPCFKLLFLASWKAITLTFAV
jgi:hypothetical protein